MAGVQKIKAIPKSRAKTAYGLLNEVKRLILEEPKRYSQEVFLLTNPDDLLHFKVPECGTVGCVAGWTCALKGAANQPYYCIGTYAAHLLGLSPDQRKELFDAYAIDRLDSSPAIQTKAYARLGVKHISAFQKKYAAQLKAKKV